MILMIINFIPHATQFLNAMKHNYY